MCGKVVRVSTTSCAGHADAEGGGLGVGLDEGDLGGVGFGEFGGDVEAEAEAGAFALAGAVGTEEALEETGLHFGWDAGAGVDDGEVGLGTFTMQAKGHGAAGVVVFDCVGK